MSGRSGLILRFSFVAVLASSGAACTTTDGTHAPLPQPKLDVDDKLVEACINAAAARYYILPGRVTALDAKPRGKDFELTLKADTRDALCTVSAKGAVRSVVDTTPKSEDQIAAEEKAKAAEEDASKKKPKS